MKNDTSSSEDIFQTLIKKAIPLISTKYKYSAEVGINPAYENISEGYHCPIKENDKRIFVLRGDFILATGIKNSAHEYGNKPFDLFSEKVQTNPEKYLNIDDRYGHPSLALPDLEHGYDGLVYLGGYLSQRDGYLQVYLMSGRFSQDTLSIEQQKLLEMYLAKKFIDAYGEQKIRFYNYIGDVLEEGNSAHEEKKKFFHNQDLNKPFRTYDSKAIEFFSKSLQAQKTPINIQKTSTFDDTARSSQVSFKHLLHVLSEKENKFSRKGKTDDSKAVSQLHHDLIFAAHKYNLSSKNQNDHTEFKESCIKSVRTAKNLLEQHRGWSIFFEKFTLAIMTFDEPSVESKHAINFNKFSFFEAKKSNQQSKEPNEHTYIPMHQCGADSSTVNFYNKPVTGTKQIGG